MGLREVAALVARRELSAVELVEHNLRRADAAEPAIRSLVERCDARAMDEARNADREIAHTGPRSHLHGIPITVKDAIDVAGLHTTVASPILADNIADTSAAAVARLEAAGAIVIAKANTHQFTLGGDTPPTRNPWDVERIPGGSSGGSGAALAAGIGYGSLGTDTGGSVRSPASYNGIVGLKPTHGRIPTDGCYPLAWSLDSVGPMARRVEDVALLLDTTSGSTAEPSLTGLRECGSGLRVGFVEDFFFEPIQLEVGRAARRSLEAFTAAGARVEPIKLPRPDIIELSLPLIFVTILAEAAAWHRPWLRDRPDQYAPDVLSMLEVGSEITAMDYLDAQRVRTLLRSAVQAAFDQVDVIAVPTHPQVAPRFDEPTVTYDGGTTAQRDVAGIRNLAIFNLTGHPAVSIPTGLVDGLPVALQLIARPGADATALRAAQVLEDQLGVLGLAPPGPHRMQAGEPGRA